MRTLFFILRFSFLTLMINACNPQPSKGVANKEIIFIDQHLSEIIDTSFIYRYRSFFASNEDTVNTSRDTLVVSVWHELLPLDEHLHYLPKYLRDAKLQQFIPAFSDTATKSMAADLDFSQVNKIGLIKFMPRSFNLKHKVVPGTIGDLQFYRVLFDKKYEHAITMVRYWTGTVSAVLKLYLFEQKNGEWRRIREEIIEQF